MLFPAATSAYASRDALGAAEAISTLVPGLGFREERNVPCVLHPLLPVLLRFERRFDPVDAFLSRLH